MKLYTNKNKYGYTTIQLLIDFDKKEYYTGNLKHFDVGIKTTKKAIHEKMQELDKLGFKHVLKL